MAVLSTWLNEAFSLTGLSMIEVLEILGRVRTIERRDISMEFMGLGVKVEQRILPTGYQSSRRNGYRLNNELDRKEGRHDIAPLAS